MCIDICPSSSWLKPQRSHWTGQIINPSCITGLIPVKILIGGSYPRLMGINRPSNFPLCHLMIYHSYILISCYISLHPITFHYVVTSRVIISYLIVSMHNLLGLSPVNIPKLDRGFPLLFTQRTQIPYRFPSHGGFSTGKIAKFTQPFPPGSPHSREGPKDIRQVRWLKFLARELHQGSRMDRLPIKLR